MRSTLRNPNGSFRLLMSRFGDFKIEKQQGERVMFGELVNELGQYEDLGTIEELRNLKRRYGKK